MAILCASPSSLMATTSGRSSFPAVGFSLSCLKPKTLCRYQVNTAFLFNTSKRPNFVVRCEKKDKDTESDSDNKRKSKNLARVPLDQRWMFEESELNGPDIWNKTWYPKAADHVPTDKPWYVVDATDKILGRLASTIAIYIRGKNLATYTPSVDMGAFVIVVCGLFSNPCMFVLLPYQADRA